MMALPDLLLQCFCHYPQHTFAAAFYITFVAYSPHLYDCSDLLLTFPPRSWAWIWGENGKQYPCQDRAKSTRWFWKAGAAPFLWMELVCLGLLVMLLLLLQPLAKYETGKLAIDWRQSFSVSKRVETAYKFARCVPSWSTPCHSLAKKLADWQSNQNRETSSLTYKHS